MQKIYFFTALLGLFRKEKQKTLRVASKTYHTQHIERERGRGERKGPIIC